MIFVALLGTQECTVCGNSIKAPHARYRIANKQVICKSCYQKAEIQASQMKFGKIQLTAHEVKKQIQDIQKYRKIADRQSEHVKSQLLKLGIQADTLADFLEERLSAIALNLKNNEPILAAIVGETTPANDLLMVTRKKIIRLVDGQIFSYPLSSIGKSLAINGSTVEFSVDDQLISFTTANLEQLQQFITITNDKLKN